MANGGRRSANNQVSLQACYFISIHVFAHFTPELLHGFIGAIFFELMHHFLADARNCCEIITGSGVEVHRNEYVLLNSGDFIFIEPGVPHEVFNTSDSEPVVAVVARSDASEWSNIVNYDRETGTQTGDVVAER